MDMDRITWNDEHIKEVDRFKYVGPMVNTTGGEYVDMLQTIQRDANLRHRLKVILPKRNI